MYFHWKVNILLSRFKWLISWLVLLYQERNYIENTNLYNTRACVVSGSLRYFELSVTENLISNRVKLAYTRTFIMSHRHFSSRLYPRCGMAVTLKFSDLDLVSAKCWFSAQLGSSGHAWLFRGGWRPFFRLLSQVLLSKGWSDHVPGMCNYRDWGPDHLGSWEL